MDVKDLITPPPKPNKRKKRMRLPPGLGSVHHINDGKNRRRPWRARVLSHVELDTETGTAKQKYITVGYFATETDAIEALLSYRKNPYTFEAATCTFAELFEMWKVKKYATISQSGQNGYNSAFRNSAALHEMKVRDIRTAHLENIIQTIECGYEGQSRMKTLWGQLFKYAIENDIIQKNYADFVQLRDKVPETTRTAIPPEDRKKIWEAVEAGDRDAEIAMIYIYTGMRPSELIEVAKANVDLDKRILIGGKKTNAGKNRHVPIHPCIVPFVRRLMETPGDMLIMRYDKPTPAVMTYNRFRTYHWDALMKRLGMEYTGHYTRHTCATMLREADIEEDIRKLILGHSSADITDRYTHITDEMLVEAIDRLPGHE